jgi:hypothetical protein
MVYNRSMITENERPKTRTNDSRYIPTVAETVFDPADLFVRAIEPHELIAAHRRIRYCAFVDPGLARLKGDLSPLRHVLAYLIEAAFEHAHRHGTIQAAIERTAECETRATVRFRIEYTGRDLTVYERAFVYEPHRYETTLPDVAFRMRSLALAHALIRRLGGALEIEPTQNGNAFSFQLAFAKAEAKRTYHPPAFKQLRVAYYDPSASDRAEEARPLRWMLRYWRILAAEVTVVDTLDSGVAEAYDLLVVDHADEAVRSRIDTIKALRMRTVVVGHRSYRHETEPLIDARTSVVSRPVHYGLLIDAVARLVG